MAAPTTAITVIKRFTYRGDPLEEYSNKYMFTGSTPGSPSAWRALFDALVTQEKVCYPASVSVVRGYGYDDPDPNANNVWSIDLTVAPDSPVAGTMSTTSQVQCPGDDAVLLKWRLIRQNSKGKWIYLRKYYHPAFITSGAPDLVSSVQLAALNGLGTKLIDGTFIDGRTITDKLGSTVANRAALTTVTTRTLKRRGKRPPT